MPDNGATFGINLQGNASSVSRDTAAALENLRSSFKGAEDRSRELQASLRGLSGKSAEVTAAKAELKAALAAERTTMNQASLAIIKQGSDYGALAKKAKEGADANKGLSSAVKTMGGPLGEAQGRIESLRESLSGASVAQLGMAAGAGILVAAVVAVTTAVIAGTAAFARWVLAGADANRNLELFREGAVRAAGNAGNLGTQVDALAKRVPIAKSELNTMATELYRAFNNTTLSGAGIVDAMNIVGQATAAAGSKVASTFQGILERGKMVGRMQLNPLELQGTGITFQDVAKQLADQLHIGVAQAQKALFEGRVKLDQGAHALSAAVNARFGELNARKMLSFDSLVMKFHESLDNLTSGVKIEPLGKAVKSLFDAFDDSTATGQALKSLVDVVGNGLVKGLVIAVPLVRGALLGIGTAALDIGISVLKTALSIKKTFGLDGKSNLLTFENAVTAGKVAVYGLATVLGVAAVAMTVLTAPIWGTAAALYGLYTAGQAVYGKLKAIDWSGLWNGATAWGANIVDGLIQGLTARWDAAKEAVKGLASGMSQSFKSALGIQSPSKVFEGHAQNIVAGLTGGLARGQGAVQDAADDLAPSPPSMGAQGGSSWTASSGSSQGYGGSSGGKVELHVHINAPGATQGTVQAMSAPPFIGLLTETFEHLLQASGVLTQAVPT